MGSIFQQSANHGHTETAFVTDIGQFDDRLLLRILKTNASLYLYGYDGQQGDEVVFFQIYRTNNCIVLQKQERYIYHSKTSTMSPDNSMHFCIALPDTMNIQDIREFWRHFMGTVGSAPSWGYYEGTPDLDEICENVIQLIKTCNTDTIIRLK